MALLTTATLTKLPLILSSSFPSSNSSTSTSTSTSSSCIKFQHQTHNFRSLYLGPSPAFRRNPITIIPRTSYNVGKRHVVCMAPEEEKMTRRSPLDFPITPNLKFNRASSLSLSHLGLLYGVELVVESWQILKINEHIAYTVKEWERPKPGRRPDIFPQFSPMKTPLPIPMPADPPEEEEEEEEKKEEEEEDPEKVEEPENPEKQ
ncbi:Uncharacterized protein TCM_028736 [Theobroma cacao]|uniref:Uncharacterized protein n=1 Tax=Theobroma cacao TaxID=3641 RepID=A0A061GCA4_THECC|nr:Uncharacterized protein TCM_028736 [Theobroma cacao]